MRSERITISIREPLVLWFKKRAKKEQRSLSAQIVHALEVYTDEHCMDEKTPERGGQ